MILKYAHFHETKNIWQKHERIMLFSLTKCMNSLKLNLTSVAISNAKYIRLPYYYLMQIKTINVVGITLIVYNNNN